ncbi:MAG: anhydro-N-acetylmuramic acid kinase [Saprospiraceae bacterium]|jgi:anhydro-N-acetylmuramic acid kinase
MIIAGVMSGSSLDGLDIALVEFRDEEWSICETIGIAYSKEWENRLRMYYELSAAEYISLTYDYAHYIGQLLKATFSKSNVKPDYISFHGHTLVHNPGQGFTEQIGNGGIIAGITNISTLIDFRSQDVALGGVGTPLAPFLEVNYIDGYDYYLNLGGIANITYVNDDEVSAYDVCPCNQVLNHFSLEVGMPYDKGGVLASKGNFLQEQSDYFSSFDYFQQLPPKALDNNWIRQEFIEGIFNARADDVLHTYCVWMANCIANQVKSEFQTKMYSTGGGSHNTFFISQLKKALAIKKCKLVIPSKEMIDYKEAILMAALAKNYLENKKNVLSQITGASRDSIGGALYKV